MNEVANDILMHYGVGKMDGAPGRGSGRYPLGSGENPNQHSITFAQRVRDLRKEGLSEKEIAKRMGILDEKGEGHVRGLRAQYAIAYHEERSAKVDQVKALKDKGLSPTQIGRELGIGESTVRSLLNQDAEARMTASMKTADLLKKQVNEKGKIEVGPGVERELGVSRTKFDEALAILKEEGYPTYKGRIDNPTNPNPNNKTTISVLCPPGTQHKEMWNLDEISSVGNYISDDGGETFRKRFEYPASMNSKRMEIRWGPEGGDDKDGVVEIRRGVEDLSLGESHYAQVRILVDGTHYIKGMAVYADDLPPGIDVRFNTNKKKGTPIMSDDPDAKQVLKPIDTKNPENPFGSLIKDADQGGQYHYTDKNGQDKLGLINKRADEGDWNEWADKVPTQFLSKQPIQLAKQQLNLSMANKKQEYEDICKITNPTLKKTMLKSFAETCDKDSVTLKAAALPKQKYKVILPLTTIKENECYCPSIKDGTKVALIRYPHGGTFEIPIVTVNNKNAEGKRVITPQSSDALGLRKKVADRLSGADFDGDTVMAIPLNSRVKIKSTPPLKDLEGFDPKESYPKYKGMPVLSKKRTQIEMGMVSNLITDMTIRGAKDEELARAVKHSMVVIDAHKHKLDYKKSEKENGILELKKKYQYEYDSEGNLKSKGAATIISKAKSPVYIPLRGGQPKIDPVTGEMVYKESKYAHYTDYKTGKDKTHTQKVPLMSLHKDAHDLVSSQQGPMELLYANYANFHKNMANTARKQYLSTKEIKYDARANKTFSKEVKSLENKLMISMANQPKERYATILADSRINAKKKAYDLDKDELKKVKTQEMTRARTEVGAERKVVHITENEFKAIQAGAISKSKQELIFKYADPDELKQLSMPRSQKGLSDSQKATIKAMQASGHTLSEIAERFGVSTSTISKQLKG